MKELQCWFRRVLRLWSAGGQEGRARTLLAWSQFCELTERWDLFIPMKQNLLVLHVLYGIGGKHFHCTLIHPLLLLLKFWMVYSSFRALQVISPPYMHKPTRSPCLSFGLFSPTHNIKKWSAMKPFLIHHKCGEDLSQKGEIRCESTDSTFKASWSTVASSSLEV